MREGKGRCCWGGGGRRRDHFRSHGHQVARHFGLSFVDPGKRNRDEPRPPAELAPGPGRPGAEDTEGRAPHRHPAAARVAHGGTATDITGAQRPISRGHSDRYKGGPHPARGMEVSHRSRTCASRETAPRHRFCRFVGPGGYRYHTTHPHHTTPHHTTPHRTARRHTARHDTTPHHTTPHHTTVHRMRGAAGRG